MNNKENSEHFEKKIDDLLNPEVRQSLSKLRPLLGLMGMGVLKRLAEHFYNKGLQENHLTIRQMEGDVAKLQAKIGGLDRLFGCELYKHHSGRVYQLICVANTVVTDPSYVPTAVYKDIDTGAVYSRPYAEFEEKFTLFSAPVDAA